MSQAKVDKYKEEKSVRKETVKRQKAKKKAVKVVVVLIIIAFFAWVGYSAYMDYQARQPKTTTEINMDAINEFRGLDTSDTE
ncbi:MAG: hypothetical protein IJ471_07510 [Eubacterium sp.]|nr:hypothetical protein [Eubacterium sp.]